MGDRDMTSAMLAELDNAKVQPVYLVELEFDAGTAYATDASRAVVWDGNTYVATYGLMGFDGLSETGELLVNQVTVSLSGVDTAKGLDAILNDDFLDRDMRIYIAMQDDSGAIVSDPLKIFEGRMDRPSFSEDPDSGTATVSVRGTPAWADFGRRPGRHTNDEEQQFYFSGDLGFEFVSELPKVLTWGRG